MYFDLNDDIALPYERMNVPLFKSVHNGNFTLGY